MATEPTWRHTVADTVGWLLVGEGEDSQPPQHMVDSANRTIRQLIDEVTQAGTELEATHQKLEDLDLEISSLQGQLAERDKQLAAARLALRDAVSYSGDPRKAADRLSQEKIVGNGATHELAAKLAARRRLSDAAGEKPDR